MINQRLSTPQEHELQISDFFAGSVHYVGSANCIDAPLLLIGFHNRSGSNLLAEYMRSTGLFSGFREHLNYETVSMIQPNTNAKSFTDYILALYRFNTRDGEHFGFKASWGQIMMLFRWNIHSMYTGVKLIHIVRRDKLAQAVSRLIASQTGKWSSEQGVNEKRAPEFSAEQIESYIDDANFSDAAIPYITRLYNISYERIDYEDIVRDPVLQMQKVSQHFIGKNLHKWQPVDVSLKRQADAMNEAFCAEYIRCSAQRCLAMS